MKELLQLVGAVVVLGFILFAGICLCQYKGQ